LTAVSTFGHSIPPFFVSKNIIFEKDLLAKLEIYEGYDYTIRTAPKTFLTEVLFIDVLQTVLLPWVEMGWQRTHCNGPVVLLLDGRATHFTP
jgi:hypothetical protein